MFQSERDRMTFLNDPRKLPKNPPELFEKVQVKVLRPFCIAGKPVEIGSVVSVERHVAQAIGKVELVS